MSTIITDTATAIAQDDEGNPIQDSDEAAVAIVAPPLIDVCRDVMPRCVAKAGDLALYTVRVANPNTNTALTLTSLLDDLFGDLTDPANEQIEPTDHPCGLATIPPGGEYTCTFEAAVAVAGDCECMTDTVTVTARDRCQNEASDSDWAAVGICMKPPDTGVALSAPPLVGGPAGIGLTPIALGMLVHARMRTGD